MKRNAHSLVDNNIILKFGYGGGRESEAGYKGLKSYRSEFIMAGQKLK